MCRITDKFILCSCDSDLDLHGNHWILNRFRKVKGEIIIGQLMLLYDLDPEIECYNVPLIKEESIKETALILKLNFEKRIN